jgi:hypothetical protein
VSDWLLLTYKVPREPTSSRVYVWRKLKHIGALLLHDSVWILPSNARTQEQFQWLAGEIDELGGEAILVLADLLLPGQHSQLSERFRNQADDGYRNVLNGLKKRRRDLLALGRQFQHAQTLDFFQSELAGQTRKALLAAQGE